MLCKAHRISNRTTNLNLLSVKAIKIPAKHYINISSINGTELTIINMCILAMIVVKRIL